jgi:hypothetical protein
LFTAEEAEKNIRPGGNFPAFSVHETLSSAFPWYNQNRNLFPRRDAELAKFKS